MMKRKSSFILSLFVLFFLIEISLVDGLIINQSTYSITKTAGINYNEFKFRIINNGPHPMYDIQSDNSIIQFPKISFLGVSQYADITPVITIDDENNYSFMIYGYYNVSDVGLSTDTHYVNINSQIGTFFKNSIDKCDLSIESGDTVIWVKKTNQSIFLVQYPNIPLNIWLLQFTNPPTQSFKYCLSPAYFCWEYCTISISDSSGLVYGSNLEALGSLYININYNPTTISYTILTKNYTINVFDFKSEGMLITNTGSVIAKKVHLNGEWFSFSDNDFDINAGQTKAVTYTIKPVVSKTNDTNKNYVKTLIISGNFNNISENFNVYVPYMNLDNANATSNYGTLMDIIKQWCIEHPQESFCRNESHVIYVGNDTDQMFNVTFGAEQVRGIFDYMFKTGDDLGILGNYIKEHFNSQGNYLDLLANKSINIDTRLTTLEERQTNQSSAMIFAFIAGSLLLFCGMTGTIIYLVKIRNKKRDFKRF